MKDIIYRYEEPIKEAIFLKRINRFIAEILIDEKIEIAHVKNTGRLSDILKPNVKCWVQESDNPNRKTKYDLISIEYKAKIANIDSQVPNNIIYEAFKNNGIEGWENPDKIEREVKILKSRLDFKITKDSKVLYVEVKGVNLIKEGGLASFPDAKTERGSKHLNELLELKNLGYQTMILFVVLFEDANKFKPNDEIDPLFSETFYRILSNGVESRVYTCKVQPNSISLNKKVTIITQS